MFDVHLYDWLTPGAKVQIHVFNQPLGFEQTTNVCSQKERGEKTQ